MEMPPDHPLRLEIATCQKQLERCRQRVGLAFQAERAAEADGSTLVDLRRAVRLNLQGEQMHWEERLAAAASALAAASKPEIERPSTSGTTRTHRQPTPRP